MDYDAIFFNAAAFIAGLFVLEYGADTFIDHVAKVASRLRVSPTIIALITAGAEWEELVVVVAAISQNRTSLALGNILGSSISNILGAFSLGLIFSPVHVKFDRSAKIYTSLLLALTTIFGIFITFFRGLGRIGGALLVTTFGLYIISIAYYIYKGVIQAPENEDSDSDSDSDGDDDANEHGNESSRRRSAISSLRGEQATPDETVGLLDPEQGVPQSPTGEDLGTVQAPSPRHRHSLIYHLAHLTLGFFALSLSGYVLSHSISTLADALSLSASLLGITLLSFATTLPEKLVAVFGGARSQGGIVVANTVGSNIFLLTLCAGILFLTGDIEFLKGGKGMSLFEVLSVWGSSLLLWGIVMVGGSKWMGWLLMGLYIGFIVIELVFFRD